MSEQSAAHAGGDAVLQIAIQMEDLGRDFYSDIARSLPGEKTVQTVLSEEHQHLEALTGVRNRRRGRT